MAQLVRLTLRIVDVALTGGGTCSRYQAGAGARGELLTYVGEANLLRKLR